MQKLQKELSCDRLRASLERRFWAKVEVREPSECWPWTAKSKHKFGYGIMSASTARSTYSHWVAWALNSGPNNPNYGKRPPDHVIEAIKRNHRKGFKHSEETKQKMREAALRRYAPQ